MENTESKESKEEIISTPYFGVNMNNLRKALYYIFFGQKGADDLSNDNYRYIIPMNASWENPLREAKSKDTYIQFLIERDESITMDFTSEYNEEPKVNKGYSVQDKVAHILLRFIGKHAEAWSKTMNHLIQREDIANIWALTCNAGMMPYVQPTYIHQIDYYGKNTSLAFDVRFALRYKEEMKLGWQPLEGIEMSVVGNIDYAEMREEKN